MADDKETGGAKHEAVIAEVRAAVLANTTGEKQQRLLARLHTIENSVETSSFGEHVKALVDEVEEDAASIAPFLARLSSLLP
jgi:hypothetical protein